jgi:hypothetical protein
MVCPPATSFGLWPIGLLVCWNFWLSGFWDLGLLGCWAVGLLGSLALELFFLFAELHYKISGVQSAYIMVVVVIGANWYQIELVELCMRSSEHGM